ncbi:MAG: acetoacetate--CoA ligase, partial [Verrucomicrobiia bacterium]
AVFGARGELVCRRPFPSMPIAFWDDPGDAKYRRAYFRKGDGVWYHGDYVSLTQSQGDCGGVVVFGRSDATLNPGGVRIGTAEIYSLVETIPWVQDSIVVGQPYAGDVRIILFLQLVSGKDLSPERIAEVKKLIRRQASPRHVPALILATPAIPYTLSGKKVELAVREVLAGDDPANTEALANPEALAHFRDRPELVEGC